MKKKKKGYGFLLGLTVVFTLATISTLIPVTSTGKACLLGYKAHCPFTPIGTIICLLGVWFSCIIRKKKFTEDV
ncbi:MAG: hypothetical protein ABIL68_15080 [bacterium]